MKRFVITATVGGLLGILAMSATTLVMPTAQVAAQAPTALGRDGVIAHVIGMKSEVMRLDRIAAKRTTWGEFERLRGKDYAISPFAAELAVWVVSVAGDIRPQAGHGKHYPWSVIVFNAVTAQPIFSHSGRTGTWPTYFDPIQDAAP
jgi:hypothetical protein